MIRMTILGRLPGLNEYIALERANRHKAAKLKRDTECRIAVTTARFGGGVKNYTPELE